MKNGTRVDLTSFSRVLVKFIYPGSPPPRGEVCTWLFRACGGQVSADGSATGKGADPDVLIDMVFDEGGVRLNKWGFVQPVAAASDVGRPQIAKGPIQRRSGALPAQTKDIAYRYLSEFRPPLADITVGVNGSLQPVVGTYAPGDWCSLVIDDEFVRMRLASDLEPRDTVIVRKIDSYTVSVPNSPTFPEKVSLKLIAEWEVDKRG
jgi:hypothetical protein